MRRRIMHKMTNCTFVSLPSVEDPTPDAHPSPFCFYRKMSKILSHIYIYVLFCQKSVVSGGIAPWSPTRALKPLGTWRQTPSSPFYCPLPPFWNFCIFHWYFSMWICGLNALGQGLTFNKTCILQNLSPFPLPFQSPPWKKYPPLIWTNLSPLHPRTTCDRFNWNRLSGVEKSNWRHDVSA